MQNNNNTTSKKLTASLIAIVILAVCLSITTFALVYSMVSVNDNLFQTGVVKINLNDGKAVITEDEFLFEPGMTVKKDFFVQNEGTCDIYYRLYFKNVTGGLADMLEVKICDGDKVLFSGTPKELERQNVEAADDILKLSERRDLQIYFHFPKNVGNEGQDLYLSFDIAADAVQTKNNSLKEFD